MGTLERLDSKLSLVLRPDDELTELGIEYRESTIKSIESMHDQVVKFRGSNSRYASIINDLALSLSLWLDGYEMDVEDPEKLRSMLCTACAMIGKPRTIEELAELLGLDMDGNVVIREERDLAQTGNYTTRHNCSLCDHVLSSKGITGEYDHHFRLICDGCYDRLCDLLEDK